MMKKYSGAVIYRDGKIFPQTGGNRHGTIARGIIDRHLTEEPGDDGRLSVKFDALASHDITYVGIIQTARASGLDSFPVPYVLTNCHNSLCAVGGTINEDDHAFGLSAAKKYGGIFVPPHVAVIHQYMREMYAGAGKMIIGSDSHTRYGALGTLGVGEGGPELVKQLLGKAYEISSPEVICVYLTGKPGRGVGPQDVALELIRNTFSDGFVKNRVMEFIGPGVSELSAEYRIGIDVMTTETTCWSSVWRTDEKVKEYLEIHGRGGDFAVLEPEEGAGYDGSIELDLSEVRPMIALPFHPSNAYTIDEFLENAPDILRETEKKAREQYGSKVGEYKLTDKFYDGCMHVDQGVIAGCSGGTFENICRAADIIGENDIGNGGYSLSVYPASEPVYLELMKNGALASLTRSGATVRSCFCGPCFGAGDVPANNAFSIRHTTRNFPNREGSKPGDGQISWVALMDARSIAATSLNHGILTPADRAEPAAEGRYGVRGYSFDPGIYGNRVYDGYGRAEPELPLVFGPNISDWPRMEELTDNILLEAASVIYDPVTTTDELIPSGETSSLRSNPEKLSGYALSRKDPAYVGRAKNVRNTEKTRLAYCSGENITEGEAQLLRDIYSPFGSPEELAANTQIGSVVCAVKPGDGSAREQAASCQKVLGGFANIAESYATKRYRSNLINWGMIPFTVDDLKALRLEPGDRILVRGIRKAVEAAGSGVTTEGELARKDGSVEKITLSLGALTSGEREIILSGCLINYYGKNR